jgi:basic membrane protein A and related proteins
MKLRVTLAITAVVVSLLGAPQASAATNICLAYDTGGPGDRSYNDATLAGIKKAQNQYTFTYESVVTDGTIADRTKRIRTLTSKSCSTIIAVGGQYAKTIEPLAIEFPNTQFAIIGDASIPSLNVTSVIFSEREAAFLAGYSAALASKSGRVAMVTTPSNADGYENGFLLGVSATKKNVRPFVKYTATESVVSAKALISLGIDVIYDATTGSVDGLFEAIVKANTAKNRKKNAPEVNLIITEPDLYLSVTPATSKYLIASVVKRVDIAVSAIIGKAINNSQLSDVIDAKAGIYGQRYGISNKGIEIVIKSKTLAAQSAAINAAASAAYAN